MYLLDTNVVSELRRPKPHGAVVAWLASVPAVDLHLSAVTLGELQRGVEMTRRQDAAKARAIEAWIEQLANAVTVLPMDGDAFRTWARILDRRSMALAGDAMIAATALVHRLVVVTRNLKDFAGFGVQTFDPFQFGKRRP